jgi:hypothetical protein
VFRTIAEATVRHRRSALSDLSAQDSTERINAAESILPLLTEDERRCQKRRIAGLKRARTLALRTCGVRQQLAHQTRRGPCEMALFRFNVALRTG